MKKIWQSAIQIILAASAGFVIGFILASSFPKQYLLASILIFIVSLFFIFPLAIIIHESGHLVMGLLTGYRFSSFRIGKILILKQNNHLKIKKFSISGTGGQCLLIPPSYRSNFPFFFYNAGGGIFNLLTAILVVVLIKTFVVSPIRVNGASMDPTLNDKDIMLLDEISYRFSDIERFDIVVVKEEDEYLIKRVIGLPGETVEYKNDKLYIDGKYVKEDFKHKETFDFSTTLGKDEYFIMGDNRTNSTDSRVFGPISRDKIMGKTSLTILPISRFGNKD